MTTRKIIIENEYLRLSQKITNILDKQIMPSLDTYQLSFFLWLSYIYYTRYYFLNLY